MKKKTLSNKEIRELNELISKFGFSFEKKDLVEIVEDADIKLVKQNGVTLFFYFGENIFPTLQVVNSGKANLKKILVDMGAVRFVVSGADIMRPGIVEIPDGILKDEAVIVADVNNKKPLAIGISTLNSEELRAATIGKVIKNIHFVGDDIWKAG